MPPTHSPRCLSLAASRNAIWDLSEHHVHGMNFTDFYGTRHDFVHPLSAGHHAMADMVVWLVQQALIGQLTHPLGPMDRQALDRGVPPPMYPGRGMGVDEWHCTSTSGHHVEVALTDQYGCL